MKVLAMILAGGKGTRLGQLTKKNCKPAITFGAKYRIIDYTLSNCVESGINNVGVLLQYESAFLDKYLGDGEKWGLDGLNSSLSTLAPHQSEAGEFWYRGTADALIQNLDFIDKQNPEYILVLSGDHIYTCSYKEMINQHIKNKADLTVSALKVSKEDASRFGIFEVNNNIDVVGFEEKPAKPKSLLASMGVYVFTWKVLRKFLVNDDKDKSSSHDFGKNIVPTMLKNGCKIQTYLFEGYWKDVGTLQSLHEANMDLLVDDPDETLKNKVTIYTEDTNSVPQYIGKAGSCIHSLTNQGAIILGSVKDSVISTSVLVQEGATVVNSVVMENAVIGKDAKVYNAIVGPNTVIKDKEIVNGDEKDVVLVARGETL